MKSDNEVGVSSIWGNFKRNVIDRLRKEKEEHKFDDPEGNRIQTIENKLNAMYITLTTIVGNCDKCGLVFLKDKLKTVEIKIEDYPNKPVYNKHSLFYNYCPHCIAETKKLSKAFSRKAK